MIDSSPVKAPESLCRKEIFKDFSQKISEKWARIFSCLKTIRAEILSAFYLLSIAHPLTPCFILLCHSAFRLPFSRRPPLPCSTPSLLSRIFFHLFVGRRYYLLFSRCLVGTLLPLAAITIFHSLTARSVPFSRRYTMLYTHSLPGRIFFHPFVTRHYHLPPPHSRYYFAIFRHHHPTPPRW